MPGMYNVGALKEAVGHMLCEDEGMWEYMEVVEDVVWRVS